jgi:hypothetical protein
VTAATLWADVQAARDAEADASLAFGASAAALLDAAIALAAARARLDAAETAFGRAVDAEAGLLAALGNQHVGLRHQTVVLSTRTASRVETSEE